MVKVTESFSKKKSTSPKSESSDDPDTPPKKGIYYDYSDSPISKSIGLRMPVKRLTRIFQKAKVADHISTEAMVFMAAVTDFLTEEILFCSIDVAMKEKTRLLRPRHVAKGLMNDHSFFSWLKSKVFTIYDKSLNHAKLVEVVRNEKVHNSGIAELVKEDF